MNITIEIRDAEVRNMVARVPDGIEHAMRGAMEDATTLVLTTQQTYPPPPRNSSYIRTGTLRRSWSRRITSSGLTIRGIVGSNGNMAPYNRLVQDRDEQAAIHRGRWMNTIQGTAERSESTVQRMFADRIAAEFR